MSEVIDAEFVERGLAVRDDSPPPVLFGTTDPVEVIAKATRIADALKAVVVSKKLIANIKGKEYPMVEAWLTLAAMLNLDTVCEWSRPVEHGWEARVVVKNGSGVIVASAEAQCLGNENGKKAWEGYALRSMAQTRATSKALASKLRFIMVLAGYESTPAEEMPREETPAPKAKAEPPPSWPPADPGPTDIMLERARTMGLVSGSRREELLTRAREYASSRGIEFRLGTMNSHMDLIDGERIANEPIAQASVMDWYPAAEEAIEKRRAASTKSAETKSASQAQRKKAMALFGILGYDDEQRHDAYEGICGEGVRSWSDVSRGGFAGKVIDALEAAAKA